MIRGAPQLDVSVVIPCLNEVAHIRRCLDRIFELNGGELRGKVIVVDNGSTDGSLNVISSYGDQLRLLTGPGLRISELRNRGARASRTDWLAFVDADVEVSDAWLDGLRWSVFALRKAGDAEHRAVIGATYQIPRDATWIERTWFNQLSARDNAAPPQYINGGNMAISRRLFETIGGFDAGCRTGEDVRFCCDAADSGAMIIREPLMAVVHHGYPKSVHAFFRRELWHGAGMSSWLSRPWRSRPLMLALHNLALFAAASILAIRFPARAVDIGVLGALLAALPLVLMAGRRAEREWSGWLRLTYLYLIYSAARTLALLSIAAGCSCQRGQRGAMNQDAVPNRYTDGQLRAP